MVSDVKIFEEFSKNVQRYRGEFFTKLREALTEREVSAQETVRVLSIYANYENDYVGMYDALKENDDLYFFFEVIEGILQSEKSYFEEEEEKEKYKKYEEIIQEYHELCLDLSNSEQSLFEVQEIKKFFDGKEIDYKDEIDEEDKNTPPVHLYHATLVSNIESIESNGLVGREYVTLHESDVNAVKAAYRHTKNPDDKVVLYRICTPLFIEDNYDKDNFFINKKNYGYGDVWEVNSVPYSNLLEIVRIDKAILDKLDFEICKFDIQYVRPFSNGKLK